MTNTAGPWSVARLAAHLDRPRTLAQLAAHGTHHQVAPTVAGAQLADVTDPQHRALRTAATRGLVLRGRGGESIAVLRAAARKGLLVLHPPAGGRRFDVGHATITAAGRRELARLDGANALAA
jgi:hypothetical protein